MPQFDSVATSLALVTSCALFKPAVDPVEKITLRYFNAPGSSFPADYSKPVPLAVVSLDSR